VTAAEVGASAAPEPKRACQALRGRLQALSLGAPAPRPGLPATQQAAPAPAASEARATRVSVCAIEMTHPSR
jgi:hypothetical protein